MNEFTQSILEGIPRELPSAASWDPTVNHAPKRKDVLTTEEKRQAVRNALRYFRKEHHSILAKEFADELKTHGRIYMYRYRPNYEMHARPIHEYPARSK